MLVAGVPVSVSLAVAGGGAPGAVTSTVNGPIDAVPLPSLPVMVMAPVVPSSALVGVPVNSPVFVLKVAHAGDPVIENVTVPPP